MSEVNIDWPDYIRAAIEVKLRESSRMKAAKSMDAVRNKTKKGEFNSLKSIRDDRRRS